MGLEERTIEQLPERCENCGATLTQAEKQRILDDGATAALCTTCATELAPTAEEEDSSF
jgi:ribosomal protein S27E